MCCVPYHQKAKLTYAYKNVKKKLHRNKTAVWFNKLCGSIHLTPTILKAKEGADATHSTWTLLSHINLAQLILSLFCIVTYFHNKLKNLIFYICTLILISFWYVLRKMTSRKMATQDGRNVWEVYDINIAINSHKFIRTLWFYSHGEASVHGHKIFSRVKSSS